jgi:ABC-type dipeptide/oligopeptide/nickel transport system permease subunit
MNRNLPLVVLAVLVALCLAGPLLAPYNPLEQHREIANAAPSALHWLGTDDYGRDVLSRFLAGANWSVLAGGSATALTLLIAGLAGGVAGFNGGWTDQILMRLGDLVLSLPWLYVLIGLRAVLPLSMKPRAAVAAMLGIIALVSWARPARLVRGLVLSLSERGYVEAARGFGVSGFRIFLRHVLPGTWGVLAVQTLVLFPRFVLAEVTLSFLGLGVGEPEPSWGGMILGLKQAYLLPEQWWRLLPVCLIIPLYLTCAIAVRRFRASL